ncbi:MFS transporter [Lacticaseibacillus pantheris]|nr:MFS transporter [Lacticaseibacillus pantheris]
MEDIFRRYRTLSIFALAMGCMAALGGIMSWQHSNVVMMLLAIFAMAYTIAKINPRLSAITMTLVPESQLAAMSGVDTTASMIGVPIGQGLFLTIANLINTTTAWIAYAVVAAILVVVTLAVRVRLTEPAVGDEQAPAA